MTMNYDTQKDIDTEGQRAIPNAANTPAGPKCHYCGADRRSENAYVCGTFYASRETHSGMGPTPARWQRTVGCFERQIELLKMILADQCFFADKGFQRKGYALGVDSETAATQIDYRNHPVYPTAREAVEAEIRNWMGMTPPASSPQNV